MANSYLQAYSNDCFSYVPYPGVQVCADPRACKLKVEGKGSIRVRPDTAVVILGVNTENMDLSKAQEENTAKINSVLRSLRENGIPLEDIQTLSYNIIPLYDYVEGKQVFRGYRVEHNLEVTIRNITKVGEIIDDAVDSGVNEISSINFSVDNPSAYYQQALRAAVDDALKKAGTLGSKLNVIVSKVPAQIVELGYEAGGPKPMTYQTAGTATPVQSGSVEISAHIEAVFLYRPMY